MEDMKDTSIAPDIHTALAAYGFPACDGRFSVRPYIKTKNSIMRITGEQITDPFSGAYFPDVDSPVTASFNATTSSFEIEFPITSHGDDYYVDLRPLHLENLDDKDSINGYLVLGSRTINLLSSILLSEYSAH
jgi:hypothetical protein